MILKRLKALFLDNLLIKIISLVFALMLWSYVNSKSGVEMGMVVPLELTHVPPSLVVVGGGISDVDVRIKGRESTLQRLKPGSIRAMLDLSKARSGENAFFLDPSTISGPADVEILRINPRRVAIHLEPLVQKEIEVLPKVQGRPAAGYRIDRIEVVPPRVKIAGARSVVDSISQVATEPVDVGDIKENLSREVKLNFLDKDVTVDPSKPVLVEVHVVRQR